MLQTKIIEDSNYIYICNAGIWSWDITDKVWAIKRISKATWDKDFPIYEWEPQYRFVFAASDATTLTYNYNKND